MWHRHGRDPHPSPSQSIPVPPSPSQSPQSFPVPPSPSLSLQSPQSRPVSPVPPSLPSPSQYHPVPPSLPSTTYCHHSVLSSGTSSVQGRPCIVESVSTLLLILKCCVLNRRGTCCPTATLEWSSSSWAPTPWLPSCSVFCSAQRSPVLTWRPPAEESSTSPSICPMCSASPGRTTSASDPKSSL